MKTQSRTDTTTSEIAERTFKRRGILAAAGAVAAGLLAKQAAQPVAATDGDPMFVGNIYTTAQTTELVGPYSDTLFLANNSGTGDALTGQTAGGGFATGVHGKSTSNGWGVFGEAVGAGIGVRGTASGFGYGVHGYVTGGSTGAIGVYGNSGTYGFGVRGDSGNGTGVYGVGTGGFGVYGVGGSIGVIGESTGGNGVVGAAYAAGTTSVVAGVYGTSTKTYGIIGNTTAPGYSGLTAITSTAGVAALAATSTNANAYAAYFTGTTVVQGDFVAFGGGKSAAVKDATGQHRLVYCVESPEAWFEDFGEGKLVNGTAQVALDKTFTEIAHTDSYQVFLTEYGGHNALFVAKRTASGFEVRAKDGMASAAFGWRVVAKRADIKGERLAKFDLPKINHPDPDKLPKPGKGPTGQ